MPCNASLATVSDSSADVRRRRDGNAVSSANWSNARQPGASTFPPAEVMVRCVNNAAEDLRSQLYERHVMRQHALTFEARWRNPS
jgi:hypothetical protein